ALGFGAARDKDPAIEGAKRFAWMERTEIFDDVTARKDPMKRTDRDCCKHEAAIEAFLDACKPGKTRCAVDFAAANPAFERWLISNRWLLERYRELLKRKGWRETAFDAAAPIPRYQIIRDGQWLLLIEARNLAFRGDAAGVRQIFESDTRFWRMTFTSADTL